MVLRLLCSGVIWAQKPKSAVEEKERSEHVATVEGRSDADLKRLTELDRAIHSQ